MILRSTTFGDVLRRYRLAAGLTQEELADRAQVSPRAISDLERGLRTRPWRETVQLLATALKLGAAERTQLEAAARRQTGPAPTQPPKTSPDLPTPVSRTLLPTLLSPLIGRAQAIVAVGDLLRRADVRLVTLTGSGGIGKTSLALAVASEVAPEFPDGAVFVPLEALVDHKLVAPTIAKALGLGESAARSLWETLQEYLRDRHYLLVLDNFEQVLDAAYEVRSLLAACPRLKLLVTSRSPLRLTGEREFLVPPLDLPEPGPGLALSEARQSAAVQLFVARAQAVRVDFDLTPANVAAVTGICRRLEGIPLALELAAARVKALPVEQIARRLSDRFDLLSGGQRAAPPRHQTLQATLDWSYNLLGEPERILLRRLAVFAGGFSLEASETVCAGDGLACSDILALLVRLVDQSLVVMRERDGEARYRLLEPVRQYCEEHLAAAGEDERLRERHGDWCLALAQQAEAEWLGPRQLYWIDTLEAERDNLRAALGWSMQRDSPLAVRLAGSLWFFLVLFTRAAEGRHWLNTALERPGDDMGARAMGMLGLAFELRESPETLSTARSLTEASLRIFEDVGDRRHCGWALHNLGCIALRERKFGDARVTLEASISAFRAVGDAAGAGTSLRDLGVAGEMDGDLDRASACYEESLALLRGQGDHWSLGWTLVGVASISARRGEDDRVRALLEEALPHFRTIHYQSGIADVEVNLVRLDHRAGDDRQARTRLVEAVVEGRNDAVDVRVWEGLAGLGAIAIGEGAFAAGLLLLGAALAHVPLADLRPTDRTDLENTVATARAALGEVEYARIWAEGQAMTLEQAITYALAEDRA